MFRFALPDEVRVHGFSFRSVIMTSNACGFLPSGIMCKKGTTRKSIAGPLPAEDTHASINLKNCVRTPARRIPAANRGMFPRRQLASPPPFPHAHAHIGRGIHRCCQQTTGFAQGPPKPLWCLRGTSWRAAGDPLEVCRRSHRGPGHLRKINEMSLEAHLEILHACLVSVVWTWGARGEGGRETGRGMVPRWQLAARTKFLLCWNNETLTQHM